MTIIIILLLLFYLFASIHAHHPFHSRIDKLLKDFNNTLLFGSSIQIYDLSTPARTERLFLLTPENVILYNFNKTLYYYLDSANVFCPNEFSVTKFTRETITTINNSAVYTTVCTPVSGLTLLEHFVSLKNNIPDHTIILDVHTYQIQFSILEIINYLIHYGYVDLG
jgi:hypothetical protein